MHITGRAPNPPGTGPPLAFPPWESAPPADGLGPPDHAKGHLNPESAPASPFSKGGRCHVISGTTYSRTLPSSPIHASWQGQQDDCLGIEDNLGRVVRRTHNLGLRHGTGSFGLIQHSNLSPSSAGLGGGGAQGCRAPAWLGNFHVQ